LCCYLTIIILLYIVNSYVTTTPLVIARTNPGPSHFYCSSLNLNFLFFPLCTPPPFSHSIPPSLLQAYVEYTSDGRVLKGVGKAPTRTKYEEDVYINNHTSVFGSYYSRVRALWGYSCCHSLMKNSYCTGQAGRVANDAANGQNIDVHQAR
jgi:Pre-mRNA splicing Prp18-interacting factor